MANCILDWKVQANYSKSQKKFFKAQPQLTHTEIKAYINFVFKQGILDHETSLMTHLASTYLQKTIGDEEKNKTYNSKLISQYFDAKSLEAHVEKETTRIYNHLIDYYDIRNLLDPEMYRWIMKTKTNLFGFSLDAYLLSLEDINLLLEVSETECNSEAEEALDNLEMEYQNFVDSHQCQKKIDGVCVDAITTDNNNINNSNNNQNSQKKAEL